MGGSSFLQKSNSTTRAPSRNHSFTIHKIGVIQYTICAFAILLYIYLTSSLCFIYKKAGVNRALDRRASTDRQYAALRDSRMDLFP